MSDTNTEPPDTPNRADTLRRVREQLSQSPAGVSNARPGLTTYRWTRWLHVYVSLFCFVVLLFFGATGVTLNHPEWTFGNTTDDSTQSGTLGVPSRGQDGSINYLGISEWARSTYGVSGAVADFSSAADQATITYRGPGYEADLRVDAARNTFVLTTRQAAWVGVLNDLHTGRHAKRTWRWLIDVAGVALVVVSVSGLIMQYWLRKRRRSAYLAGAAGAVAVAVLVWIALH